MVQVDVGPTLDLLQPETIDVFADAINSKYPKLDILVNNAGVSFMKKVFTPDGVGGIAQVGQRPACKSGCNSSCMRTRHDVEGVQHQSS